MDDIEVDVNAYEEARYQDILSSKKYVKLKILIGEGVKRTDDVIVTEPCMKMEVCNASSEMIGMLYTALKSYQDHLIEKYPFECLLSELTVNSKEIGTWYSSSKNNEEKKE